VAPIKPDPLPSLPSDLASLTTGKFVLPQLDQTGSELRTCFADLTRARSWSCQIPLRTFSMEVTQIPNASETANYELTLQPIDYLNSKYILGTSPPSVPDAEQLVLVNDTSGSGSGRGPAWWLQVNYTKTVVVSESQFSSDSTPTKRSWTYSDYPEDGFDPSQFKEQSKTAVDGDKPWICTWPNTTLDIYIFPNQNNSLAVATTTSSTALPAATYDPNGAVQDPGSQTSKMNRFYPSYIKFNERRSKSKETPKPSCRQVEIYDYGHQDRPVWNSKGEPTIVFIEEIEQSGKSSSERRWAINSMMARAQSDVQECGCLWQSV
jgi:hypothetical protein